MRMSAALGSRCILELPAEVNAQRWLEQFQRLGDDAWKQDAGR